MNNIEDLGDECLALLAAVEPLRTVVRIENRVTFELAAGIRRDAKEEIRRVEAKWKPLKQAKDREKAELLTSERAELENPKAALAIVDPLLTAYETAQRREQLIAQARAAEEAKAIEAARPAPAPGQAPLPPVVVPARPVEIPKVEGLGFTTRYKGHIADMRALCRAIGEGKVIPDVLEGVQQVLDEWARSFGPSTPASVTPGTQYPMPGIPGVCIVAERRPRG